MRLVIPSLMLLMLGLAETAFAQAPYCFQIQGFGNRFHLSVTPLSPRGTEFLVIGAERVFEDRTVTGTVTVGVRTPGTYRMGLTFHSITATTGNLVMNAQLSAATGSGPFTAWSDAAGMRVTGTLLMISCAGVPDEALDELPDIQTLFVRPEGPR